MVGNIVGELMCFLLLAFKELHIFEEIFRNHLCISEFDGRRKGFLILLDVVGRAIIESIGIIALGRIKTVITKAVPMKEGVIAFISVQVAVNEISEFLAEDARVHMSVKLNNYN